MRMNIRGSKEAQKFLLKNRDDKLKTVGMVLDFVIVEYQLQKKELRANRSQIRELEAELKTIA